MTFDELESLCQEAARDLAEREARPLPTAVVLPATTATAITVLPDFPDDDVERFDLLSRFAADRMVPANAPAYGFLSEATLAAGDEPADVLMVVVGARRHRPRVTAAALADDGLGAFAPAEPLDPTAMPFLSPLQHAADSAQPPDVTAGLSGGGRPGDDPTGGGLAGT